MKRGQSFSAKNTVLYYQHLVILAATESNLYLLLTLTYTTSAQNQEGDDLLNQILHFVRTEDFKFQSVRTQHRLLVYGDRNPPQ